ncbi:YraN family protein [Vallitalea maricola]|uniref:YraN family protein n=1 Tax=Vallitalea maricola TaxID=3074433 RepID=A0ACB5UPP4_9FIRM|nr:YraN family protein [Vallitalea sp. AN17-2]
MENSNNRAIGSKGEEIAAKFLEKQGYKIIDRNYRCRFGEIDIIGMDSDYLTFIEVKYRRNINTGYPIEAVGYYKQKRIIKTAMYYTKVKRLYNADIRFDVVEIVNNKIRVVKDAFKCN